MRRAGAVAAVVIVTLAAACTRAAATPDPSIAPTAAAASVSPSAAVSLVDAAVPTFAAWTDDVATAEIAKSCHAKPPRRGPLQEGERDPLLCNLPWMQSCVYNPCHQKADECRGACGDTCRTCDDACANTCDSCKGGCKDDACRSACAKSTGVCKQACLTAIDHCGTADCSAVGRACYAEETRKWKSHGCSCNRIRPCTDKCLENAGKCTGDEDCFGKCKSACAARFPGCDVLYCIMGSEPGLDR